MHIFFLGLKSILILALVSLVIRLWYDSTSLEQFFNNTIVVVYAFSTTLVAGVVLVFYWLNKSNSRYDTPKTTSAIIPAKNIVKGKQD